jgi:hypothetical protein
MSNATDTKTKIDPKTTAAAADKLKELGNKNPELETASEKKERLSRPREVSMTDTLNTLKANRDRHARLLAEDDQKIKEQEARIAAFHEGKAEREAKKAQRDAEQAKREQAMLANAPAEIAKAEAAAARALAKAEELRKRVEAAKK